MVTLDDHLIGLQIAQAQTLQLLLVFAFCLGILFGRVPGQVRDAARVIPPVGVPARILHEGGDQYDVSLGGEGEGGGVGLEVDGSQCFAA